MGNYSDDNSSTGLHGEEALIESFKNVGLNSNDHGEDGGDYGGLDHTGSHPLRPYAEDCSHFIRTGTCKFGLSCRYNHPVKRTNLVGRVKDKEGYFEKSEGQIECKYYLTTGGCKYGESCRYSHNKDQTEIPATELNFLGLPIRMGEKDCPFYMRHGSCGYGARCIFHHPDPTSFGGSSPHNSAFNHKSMGQEDYSSALSNGESGLLNMSKGSQSDNSSWSSRIPSRWEGYQASDRNRSSIQAPSSVVRMGAQYPQLEEFPERPGQPECDYFLKTGDCKFKSTCRFHHPKDRIPMAEMCTLSDKGLPLRPGKSVCRHYARYGICKFGRACLFDHPVNNDLSTHSDWSSSEPLQSHDAWEN